MIKNTNSILLKSYNLPMIKDIESLAKETRLSEKLIYFLTNEKMEERYTFFSIPKKNGKMRCICSPCASLKILQRWVLENILYKIPITQYSFGFKKGEQGSPLVACATRHKDNEFILKMDIKDFYPSIKRERVFRLFISLGYNSYASNILANICTVKGTLPQGAVTSACLANIICRKLDLRLAGYCNRKSISYTRYADDMIFSSNNRDQLHNLYGIVKKIVQNEGFIINDKKTRFLTPKNHKGVVGITVNGGRIKASKDIKRKVRTMIHSEMICGDYSLNPIIRGYISYVSSIEPNYKKDIIKYITKLLNSEIALFNKLVSQYNSNKLYKELPEMKQKNVSNFCDLNEDEYFNNVVAKRKEFLSLHGYRDICV